MTRLSTPDAGECRLPSTLTADEEQRLLLGQNAVVRWRMDPQPKQQGSYIVGDGDRERPAWLSWSTVPDAERLVGPPPTWHQEDSPVPRRGWVQADRGKVAYEVVGEQPWEVAEGGIVPAGWYWRAEVRPVVYAVVVAVWSKASVLLVEYPKLSRAGVPAMALPGGKVEDGEEPAEAARREFAEETGLPGDFTISNKPFWCGESRGGKPMWAYEAELDPGWTAAKRWFSSSGEVRMVPVRGIAAHYVPEFLPVARRVLGAYLLHREEVG